MNHEVDFAPELCVTDRRGTDRRKRSIPVAIERRSGSLCEIARQQAAGLTALTVGSISIGLLTNPAAGLCGTGALRAKITGRSCYDAQHRARPTIC